MAAGVESLARRARRSSRAAVPPALKLSLPDDGAGAARPSLRTPRSTRATVVPDLVQQTTTLFVVGPLCRQQTLKLAEQLANQSAQTLAAQTRANTKRNGGRSPIVSGFLRALRKVRSPPVPVPASPVCPATPRRPRRPGLSVSFSDTLTILSVKPGRTKLDVQYAALPPDRTPSMTTRGNMTPRRGRMSMSDLSTARRPTTPRHGVGEQPKLFTKRAISIQLDEPLVLDRPDVLPKRERRALSERLTTKVSSALVDDESDQRGPSPTSEDGEEPPNILKRMSTPRFASGLSAASWTTATTDSRTNSELSAGKSAIKDGASPTSIQTSSPQRRPRLVF